MIRYPIETLLQDFKECLNVFGDKGGHNRSYYSNENCNENSPKKVFS